MKKVLLATAIIAACTSTSALAGKSRMSYSYLSGGVHLTQHDENLTAGDETGWDVAASVQVHRDYVVGVEYREGELDNFADDVSLDRFGVSLTKLFNINKNADIYVGVGGSRSTMYIEGKGDGTYNAFGAFVGVRKLLDNFIEVTGHLSYESPTKSFIDDAIGFRIGGEFHVNRELGIGITHEFNNIEAPVTSLYARWYF